MNGIVRFGGERSAAVALAVGVVSLGASLGAAAWTPRRALASYLVAFCYWCGLAIGALLMVLVFHVASARWMVVMRRLIESMAATLPLFAVLFVPVALGARVLYPWAGPEHFLGRGDPSLLAEKGRWLAVVPFQLRAAAYFVVWAGIAEMMLRLSRRQDADGDVVLTLLERRVAAGGLPAVGLAMTFAAFDWMMSLDPGWGSTIFGVYWFAGSFLGAHALTVVAVRRGERARLLEGLVRPAHYHSLGKLTFAFVCFWAYIAFSQFMLVWIGNRPDEIAWYLPRIHGRFLPVALALFFGKFAIPFVVLLSRSIKFHPDALVPVAIFILGMQYVDVHWMVMPSVFPNGSAFAWTDLAAVVGIGGVALSVALWRLRGAAVVPQADPYLAESLAYRKP